MSHLRRQDRAITDVAEIDRILAQGRFATIALADGEKPYAVTLSYGYDAARRRLCFHVATAGRKLDVIARNPRACASVIADLGYKAGECAQPFQSVVMTGHLHVLDDPEDIRLAMRTLIGQLEGSDGVDEVWERNRLDTPAALKRFRALVLDIEDVSAKQGQ